MAIAFQLALTTPAAAQIQNCLPGQYLDRTAANADREITWDFSVASDPERCMQVQVGQTVVWKGDLETHPLGSQGGDSPNPIGLHQNGSVAFNAVGTFGFVCLAHSSMKGAINVVPAPPSPAPLSTGLAVTLTLVLLGGGAMIIRAKRRSDAPTTP